MKLSVVIPTHQKLDLLRRTLAALAAQTLPPVDWELVVVDDGSTDGTGEWLRAEAARWQGRMTVVSPAVNVGRAAARNLGVQAARGSWLLFLDDDILAPPELLASHLHLLESATGQGVIGRVETAPELVDGPHFQYIDTRGAAKCTGEFVPARYLVTQNTVVSRKAMNTVGGFDEAFRAYGFEDMELGFRLEAAGVVFRRLPGPVPLHVHHHTLDQWLAKKRECGHGPLQRIAARHPRRIREMRLGAALAPRSVLERLIAALSRTALPSLLTRLASHWPVNGRSSARCFPLYARCLDLLVLLTYCQGVRDHEAKADTAVMTG